MSDTERETEDDAPDRWSRLQDENERLRRGLRVPEVWSEFERDGMAKAFTDASHKHGLYESLFAAAAWLLGHRAS